MFDYIDDLGLSSLFIDDVDHAFVPQDDLAAFESRDAYYVLPSGPGSSSSGIPRELFDNPLAALMPVAQPPHGPDAMMHEHLINGITPWFFATPGNQGPPPASTPCDTFFA
ncbi:uncharacterized protein J4E92_007550 [Alternaria infectoria]|uniref:uncharacterized protein n=1 Tax=Alternaria infectoria TaxID=45303 RepID=UPI00221E7863|nr:uncharacterized protein J4E92_007550 [Alternaria infectoria]KAI4923576.1 hypothetical protein J4E92_007550 [Alternaria infectoria]